MNILVTGTAGFVGHTTAKVLLERGDTVIGVDNFNDYYDVSLKEDRNRELEKYPNFKLYRVDISNLEDLKKVFEENDIDRVCHLAAQAGVRYSIDNPYIYSDSNMVGVLILI